MSVRAKVTAAYERWDANDVDGLLEMFTDDAVFVVPGNTRVSGDHDKTSFRAVLDEVVVATSAGDHRQEMICMYEGEAGAVCIFDNYVTVDGATEKYHSVHEWVFRDDKPHVWMLYLHEYDVFNRAWG